MGQRLLEHLHDSREEFNTSINPQHTRLCLSKNYKSIFQRVKDEPFQIFGWLGFSSLFLAIDPTNFSLPGYRPVEAIDGWGERGGLGGEES